MTSSPDLVLVDLVRSGLAELADPAAAGPMQAYMKSAMPFRGVRAPAVRQLTRRIYDEHLIADRARWDATVRALYDEATYREERYAALKLVAHRHYRAFADPESLVLHEHLVTTGAWWDLVDEVSHRVGDVLLAHRKEAEPVIRGWSSSDDTWLRRSAVICQLGHRERTDPVLLADMVAAATDDTDFFLRKAIGWALREYARTDPDWVRTYVAAHRDRLSPLSVREALKHLA